LEIEFQTKHIIQQTIRSLLDYCIQNKWAGYDPYDGLNSRVFHAIPLIQNRIGRLIFTQAMKRLPTNVRSLFLVPKGENPKGLAIFCSALFILSKSDSLKTIDPIHHLLKRLVELRSPDTSYFCWGYNFDWQSRDIFLPKFVPNIICTIFVGNVLLDAYTKFTDSKYLDMAKSAGDFLLEGLNILKSGDEICFSYTPLDNGQVHNVNLLGAAFLSRLYSLTSEKKFLGPALRAARYSTHRQNEDGSWVYGEDKTQRWIDNFHTGYNLCALKDIGDYAGTHEFESNVNKGFKFYVNNFFREDGAPKYFHDRTYPIDIHSVAQSIITLSAFRDLDENNIKLASSVFEWAMANMWDEGGYFYFQVTPYYKNKISYMRWSQAWMLLALATLLEMDNS